MTYRRLYRLGKIDLSQHILRKIRVREEEVVTIRCIREGCCVIRSDTEINCLVPSRGERGTSDWRIWTHAGHKGMENEQCNLYADEEQHVGHLARGISGMLTRYGRLREGDTMKLKMENVKTEDSTSDFPDLSRVKTEEDIAGEYFDFTTTVKTEEDKTNECLHHSEVKTEEDVILEPQIFRNEGENIRTVDKNSSTNGAWFFARDPLSILREKLTCYHCGYKCKLKRALAVHVSIHTERVSFSCEYCHDKYSEATSKEKPFVCEICKYRCDKPNALEKHLITHTGDEKFACEHCDYSCRRRSHFQSHMKSHPRPKKHFACEHCDYECRKRSSLKIHMTIHTGVKLFGCDSCDFTSNSDHTMKAHKMTHKGEKPFACKDCDFRTTLARYLKKHVKLLHSGEKQFACESCEYRSSRQSHLKRHMQVHTGEKPFECDQCDYRSAQASNLRQHVNIHLENKPFACEHCDYRCRQAAALKHHKRKHHLKASQ